MIEYQMNIASRGNRVEQNRSKRQILQAYNQLMRNKIENTQHALNRAEEKFNSLPTPTNHSVFINKRNQVNKLARLPQQQKQKHSGIECVRDTEQSQQMCNYQQILLQQKRLVRLIEDTYSILNRTDQNHFQIKIFDKLDEYIEKTSNLQQQMSHNDTRNNYIAYTDRHSQLNKSTQHLKKQFLDNKPNQNMFSRTCQSKQKEELYKKLSYTYQFMPAKSRPDQTAITKKIKTRIVTANCTAPFIKYIKDCDETDQLVKRMQKQVKDRKQAVKIYSTQLNKK